jgi:phosphatidylinositol alpha-mannosyltransferase
LRTIRALNDEEFDVLHLHEPLVPGPTMTALYLQTAPMVGTFHSAGRNTSYQMLNGFVRSLASRLDLRVGVSKDAILLAETYLGGSYDLLFNGVDLDEYAAATVPLEREQAPTIFFCGRHEERKGLGVLLDSLQHLDRDVQCWIAGVGPDTERLRKAHQRDARIEWFGRLTDAEKVARLQRATVFCAPSLHGESFGVVLLEAMAAGTPVVASGLDGYRNVATHGHDALLVEPGDAVGLASALRETFADGSAAAERASAGLRRAGELSMERLAEEYVKRYELVIDHRELARQPAMGRTVRRGMRRMMPG